jgi:small subunit ribosomal protein S24e
MKKSVLHRNNPAAKMISSRPVYIRADEVLSHIRYHEVTICVAATGSSKTTQIPQLILDEYIWNGKGAYGNIVCTQPRRIAAISVADRVAKNERGETLGKGFVGYQVRFEAKLSEEHDSITFCTTRILLRRMQSALVLDDIEHGGSRCLDDVTHMVADEVHERDVDTDSLLVVLKRWMAHRKAKNKPQTPQNHPYERYHRFFTIPRVLPWVCGLPKPRKLGAKDRKFCF